VIAHCVDILEGAGLEGKYLTTTNFLDYSDLVRDAIKEWPAQEREECDWLKDFVLALRKFRDDFSDIVSADPMVLYKPAHSVAESFHASPALIRYFRGGNRISKTVSGFAEHYFHLTNHHPFRPHPLPPSPNATFIVGVNFSKYSKAVFERKFLSGETGNPLSPMFPTSGKWFYHYDERKKLLQIACPECAEKGLAQSCPHPKASVILFSDGEGPSPIMGGQFGLAHYDEHIRHDFFGETMKRLETVPQSSLIITGTPLQGKAAWEHQELTLLDMAGPPKNLVPGTDQPIVSLHTIDQYSAGLVPKPRIDASCNMMSAPEIEARVYGRPAAFSESAVFHLQTLHEMSVKAIKPRRGELILDQEKMIDATEKTIPGFKKTKDGAIRVWEEPIPGEQYIIGADVAFGLTNRDASAAIVLKMKRMNSMDIRFEMVSSYHGWINSLNYAEELIKLGMYYNSALLVPERRGPGDATIQRIKEFGYWNLFRDSNSPAAVMHGLDSQFGLDTNVSTKGLMVSVLQKTIYDRITHICTIRIPCFETLEQLGTYGQEMTPSGQSVKFQGAGGSHDDLVVALFLGVFAAKVYPVFDVEQAVKAERSVSLKPHISLEDQEVWDDLRQEVKGTDAN
jgi:hypothetical protein